MTDAVIELIAPDLCSEGEHVAGRLRSALTLARLLASEGRAPRANSVGLDVKRAELELTECIRTDALDLVSELFRAHLVRRSGLEPWTACVQSAQELWVGVVRLEERKLGLALPSLPDPGEGRSAVAQRILASALCLGLSEAASTNWRGHIAFSEQAPQRAEAIYQTLLADPGRGTFEERKTAVAGVVGCLLDRGVVFLAKDWMERHLDLAAAAPELIRLAGLASLAAGDLEAAEDYLAPQLRRCLPAVFATLGDRFPDLRTALSGPMDWECETAAPAAANPRRLDRSACGAAALVVLQAPNHSDSGRVLFSDLAGSLGLLDESGGANERWRDRQAAAPFTASEPEQQLLSMPNIWVGFTELEGGERLLRSCLSPTTKAVALVPVRRSQSLESDLLGWVRLEFEHRLVPDAGRLQALGEAARRVFLGLPEGQERERDGTELAPYFHKLTKGFSLGRRRWWGFVRAAAGPQFVATNGEALGNWEKDGGGCRALERAVVLAETLGKAELYRQGDLGGEALHKDAASGAVIPIQSGGTCGAVCGWLVVESARRDDIGERELRHLSSMGSRIGAEFGLARFNQWHQAHCDESILFATKNLGAMPGGLLDLLGEARREANSWGVVEVPFLRIVTQAATKSGGVIVITGAAGTGKRVAARLVLFERLADRAAPKVVSLRGLEPSALLQQVGQADGGGLILEDLEALSPEGQEVLFQLIERGEPVLRCLVITSRMGLQVSALWSRLADHLMSHEVRLADLTERRAILPGYFELFLARAAKLERRVAPVVTARAAGLIWRGTWDGGLRQLANFAHRIVIFHDHDVLDEQALKQLAHSHVVDLPKRLPSKHPDPVALWNALDANRKKSGGFHKGRTAALLGWDPDTLTQRLRELCLD